MGVVRRCEHLLRMKRSLEGSRGLLTEYRIVWKNNTDMISAIDAHDVGWLSKDERDHQTGF